jgi:hypothetical protein
MALVSLFLSPFGSLLHLRQSQWELTGLFGLQILTRIYNPLLLLFSCMLLALLLPACFMLVSCLAYSSTLKMEVVCSSEMSVDFHQTLQCYTPEDGAAHSHCCENFISNIFIMFNVILSTSNNIVSDGMMVSQ